MSEKIRTMEAEAGDPCADDENSGGLIQFFSRITNILKEDEEDEATRTYVNLGHEYQERKEYDKAFRCYDKAIKRKPSVPSYYKIRGELFLKTNHFKEAVWNLRNATYLSYTVDKELQKLLSQALFSAGMYEEAIEEIIQTHDDTEIVKLGRKMFSKGKVEEAIRCYSEAIKIKPLETKYYRLRGNCYMIVDMARKAIEDFDTAVRIHQNKDTINRVSLTQALIDIGKYDEAVNEILPLGEHEIMSLGNKLYAKEKFNQALRCYNAIIDRNLGKAEHYRSRGHCHRAMENLEDAILDFRKAIEMDSSDTESRIDMSEALLEVKRYDDVVNVVKDLDVERMESRRDAMRLTKVLEKIQAMQKSEDGAGAQVKNSIGEDLVSTTKLKEEDNEHVSGSH